MSQQRTLNTFFSQDTDTDLKRLKSEQFRSLQNGRLTGNNSDLLAMGKIKGTQHAFDLSEGYEIIGGTAYEGVLYLVSHNPAEDLIEIGTYPSPDWDNCSGQMIDEYRPLQNFTQVNYHDAQFMDDCGNFIEDVPRDDFRINNEYFGWSCRNRVDVLPIISYDGSIDLYLIDGENPNYVVNTGFRHSDGICLNRYYNEEDFIHHRHDQFNESSFRPKIKLDSIKTSGELYCGQYFIAIRYGSTDGAYTSFMILPSSITIGSKSGFEQGSIAVSGDDGNKQTNKSIILTLSNLNIQYDYFEIGYIRYADGSYEGKYLLNRFYMQGLPTTTITITGREQIATIALEEFISQKGNEKSCLAQAVINNRWYGANWKSINYHHEDFCTFAASVVIGEKTIALGQGGVTGSPDPALNHDLYANADQLTIEQYGSYNNPLRVHNSLSYRSGETYIFRLHPIFKDGRIGFGYPMKGFDNLNGLAENENTLGVYRFSALWTTSNLSGPQYLPTLEAKLATFDFSGATTTSFIDENVKGWVISRAELRKNCLYQGLSMAAFNGDVNMNDGLFFIEWDADVKVFAKNKWMPLYQGLSYWFLRKRTGDGERRVRLGHEDLSDPFEFMPNHLDQARLPNRYGIFCPDYMIDNAMGKKVDGELFLKFIGTSNNIVWQQGNGPSFSASPISRPLLEWQSWNYFDGPTQKVRLYNISAWNAQGEGGFVSKVTNGNNPLGDGFYFGQHHRFAGGDDNDDFVFNLPMNLPAYIGVEGWQTDANGDLDGGLVNVLRQPYDEVDILNWYDGNNEIYYPINYIDSIIPPTVVDDGHGDNFFGRHHIKHISADSDWDTFFTDQIDDDTDSGRSIEAGWGHMVSFISEAYHNSSLRTEKGVNGFYPATDLMDMERFASALDAPESNLYNISYSTVLQGPTLPSFIPGEYYADQRYLTRIRVSSPNDSFPLINNWRNNYAGSVADFDLAYGPIMALATLQNNLLSFQTGAINSHPVNERVYAGESVNASDKILLAVDEALPEFVQRLSDKFGLQNRFGLVKTVQGIYAMDIANRMLLRVSGQGVQPLSIQKNCDGLVKEFLEGLTTDGLAPFYNGDGICSQGVLAGYLPEYGEVHFTAYKDNNPHKTIVFSEKSDGFMGMRTYYPAIYITSKDRLYTFSNDQRNSCYLHEKTEQYNVFYEEQHLFAITFAINDKPYMEKEWHSMRINASPSELLSATNWSTQTQISNLTWASAPLWLMPVYSDHGWRLSIGRDNNGAILMGPVLVTKVQSDSPAQILLSDVLTTFVLRER